MLGEVDEFFELIYSQQIVRLTQKKALRGNREGQNRSSSNPGRWRSIIIVII